MQNVVISEILSALILENQMGVGEALVNLDICTCVSLLSSFDSELGNRRVIQEGTIWMKENYRRVIEWK